MKRTQLFAVGLGSVQTLHQIASARTLLLEAIVALLLFPSFAQADNVTAGPNGINSRGLGLNGQGVNIGQVELGRPGEALSFPADGNGEWFWDHGADQIPGTLDAGEGNGVRDFPEIFVDLDANGAYTANWRNTLRPLALIPF